MILIIEIDTKIVLFVRKFLIRWNKVRKEVLIISILLQNRYLQKKSDRTGPVGLPVDLPVWSIWLILILSLNIDNSHIQRPEEAFLCILFLVEKSLARINCLFACLCVHRVKGTSYKSLTPKEVFFNQLMTSRWWMMNTTEYDGGTCIDHWMLGIGEVWYFSMKTDVFRHTHDIFMMDVEHQCIYWWCQHWSLDVRNWWGLLFLIINRCFLTN